MVMKFSLGTKSHDVFIFKNLVDLNKNSASQSLEEFVDVVYSSEEAEFDRDLYNDAINLPAAQTVQFRYDSRLSSKYKFGQFIGKNIYKDNNGNIDISTSITSPTYGWLTQDNSSSEYCLFSTSHGDTFYIAIKDYEPGLVILDFSPLFFKLLQTQLSKYNKPANDTVQSSSYHVSLKQQVSDLIRSSKSKLLSFNSVIESKYNRVRQVIDNVYEDVMAASDIAEFGQLFINSNSEQEAALLLIKETPILNDALSTCSNIYKSARSIIDSSGLKDTKWSEFDLNDASNILRTGGNIIKSTNNAISLDYVPNIQAIIYSAPPLTSNTGTYNFNSAVDILCCLQTPEQLSYSVESSYESQSPRGSQTPYQFYQSTNQVSLSFDLKWHIDEIRDNDLLSNSGKTLQDIADMAENFARPWDNGLGSIQPKLCRVLLPSISEIGYISSVSITYNGDMTNYDDSFNDSLITNSFERQNSVDSSNIYHSSSDYTYNMLSINFTLLVVRDVKLSKGDKSVEISFESKQLKGVTDLRRINVANNPNLIL